MYVLEYCKIAILHVYVRTEQVAGTAGVPSTQHNAFQRPSNVQKARKNSNLERANYVMATAWWEQDEAVRRALTGEHLFVTGGAGTGKTETLKRIFQSLRVAHRQHGESAVWLTAMSGPAAWRLGGMTLASFAGWQDVDPVTVSPTELTTRVLHNKKAVERWCNTKALIIDEISLLHGRMLDLMNVVAQAVRGIERPFGGIQLITGGGFLSAATSG